MTNAVVENRNNAVASYGARPLIIEAVLDEESDQRRLLGQYISRHMVEGTDYGVIPGTERKNADGSLAETPKTLFKPGAEKLTTLYRCIPRFVVEDKIEDWKTGLFYYRLSCQIITQADGVVVAEGVGSCSTYESRYRWRKADRKCPQCGVPAIKKSKFPPRNKPNEAPGWYCFDKAGGCGENFAANDSSIVNQPIGRSENPDILDCVNTVLKMAKKRSHVDATITLARCSDIFTQDVEDFLDPEAAPHKGKSAPAPYPVMASAEQVATINSHSKELGLDWAKRGVRQQAGEMIGRPLGESDRPESLTSAEADIVITELLITIEKNKPAPSGPPAHGQTGDDVEEGEITAGSAEPTSAACEPPAATTGNLPSVTQKALLDAFHDLDLSWHDAKAKAAASVHIGRKIGAADHINSLTVEEANKLINALKVKITEKKAKAAAKKEKAGAA
ncbi:hypothetical protein [Zavarzinella formosa]|uniref:hypothetical protein n=1 Tax=Zavarzinella formosa TaxID=360055 RepID=UPI00030596A4|nr:hypothetical protein [Zavarzinella formosa]